MAAIITARTVDVGEPSAAESQKMTIATEDGSLEWVVRYAPRAISYSNLARTWTEVARPGLAPILSPGEVPLPKIGYDLILGDLDPYVDVEADWNALVELAQSEARIVVSFGPAEAGLWRFTLLSGQSIHRHPVTQAITQATMSVEFTRVSDFIPQVGPVSGGANPAPSPTAPTYMGGGTYVVKKGDTLTRISTRFYKTPKYWRRIADLNKIKRPKKSRKMKPGRRIKIPRIKK